MKRSIGHPHPFTDRRGRNLCDRCDKWKGAPEHATPEPTDLRAERLDDAALAGVRQMLWEHDLAYAKVPKEDGVDSWADIAARLLATLDDHAATPGPTDPRNAEDTDRHEAQDRTGPTGDGGPVVGVRGLPQVRGAGGQSDPLLAASGSVAATPEPTDLRAEHSLTIGGYGVHCSCGTYFHGFGPNPRPMPASVKAYGIVDETLTEHLIRVAHRCTVDEAALAEALHDVDPIIDGRRGDAGHSPTCEDRAAAIVARLRGES